MTSRTDLLPVRIEDAERTIREEVDLLAHIFGEDSQFVLRTRVALASLRDCALTARRRE